MVDDQAFDRLLSLVEKLSAAFHLHLRAELGAVDPEADAAEEEWKAWLAEHEELRGHLDEGGTFHDGRPRPASFFYSDRVGDSRIVAALTKLAPTHPEGASTEDVLVALFGSSDEARARGRGDYFDSSRVPQQVGNRLWSLKLRGVVERTRKREGGVPALWRVAKGSAHA